jgi:hypothetical protein
VLLRHEEDRFEEEAVLFQKPCGNANQEFENYHKFNLLPGRALRQLLHPKAAAKRCSNLPFRTCAGRR